MWPLDQTLFSASAALCPSALPAPATKETRRCLLRELQTLSSPSSSLFWHPLQMTEHLWSGPKPSKILLQGYFQKFISSFPKTVINFPKQQEWSWYNQSLSNFCYSSSLGKYTSLFKYQSGRRILVCFWFSTELWSLPFLLALYATWPTSEASLKQCVNNSPIFESIWELAPQHTPSVWLK